MAYEIKAGKIVRSRSGRFAQLREAQEAFNGRCLYLGRYRTRAEIAEYIAAQRAWKGARIVRTSNGWEFTKGTAHLSLRADSAAHDHMIAECEEFERQAA